MNKAILRTLLTTLTPATMLTLHMRGSDPQPVEVVATRRGRGKGGSMLATLRLANGDEMEIGTPRCDEVLSVTTPDGNFHGVSSAAAEPPVYPRDEANAVLLKEQLNSLVGEVGVGARLELHSSVPAFDGVFTIMSSRRERGRGGQLHFSLLRATTDGENDELEFHTYRHSGIVTAVTVL